MAEKKYRLAGGIAGASTGLVITALQEAGWLQGWNLPARIVLGAAIGLAVFYLVRSVTVYLTSGKDAV